MEELILQIEGKPMRYFRCIGYGKWAERQPYVRGRRISHHVGREIHLPRRQKVRFSIRGVGLIGVTLKLDVETRLSDVARWFGINSGFDSESYLKLATKHFHGRLEEIVKEAAQSGDEGLWTDRATIAIGAIDPSSIILPGKIYRVSSLEILPPTKLALALADEQQ
jgi:hypothetical protein